MRWLVGGSLALAACIPPLPDEVDTGGTETQTGGTSTGPTSSSGPTTTAPTTTVGTGSETGGSTGGMQLDVDLGGRPCLTQVYRPDMGGVAILQPMESEFIEDQGFGELTCSFTPGPGNGALPTGVSFSAQTCRFVGDVDELRWGIFATVVQVERDGQVGWIPVCLERIANGDGTEYAVIGNYESTMVIDSGSQIHNPIVDTVTATGPIRFGESQTPSFLVEDTQLTITGFGVDALVVSPQIGDETLTADVMQQPIHGFNHELQLLGSEMLPTALQGRPLAFTFELRWCLSEQAQGVDCDVNGPIGGFNNGSNEAVVGLFLMPQ